MTEDTYEMDAVCDNCDFRGKVNIPKGVLVKKAPCPKCGNQTLRNALPGEVG